MNPWPELRYSQWADTCQTLQLWTQVAGKIRMALTPPINHWWHVPLYVNTRGLETSPIPYGSGTFELEFDFVAHKLRLHTSEGLERELALKPMTVADFYAATMAMLREAGITVEISTMPSEIADAIAFEKDTTHASYDAEAVERFSHALVSICRVFTEFRGRFLGKVSPIHFFWGSFDLAVTRFSGREAPLHPGAPGLPLAVTREAYSHEVSSAGFWPGGPAFDAAFYAYAYPEPAGYAASPVAPAEAFYGTEMREHFLPYETVRTSADPAGMLMEFLQSTYEAAANSAAWDRGALERKR